MCLHGVGISISICHPCGQPPGSGCGGRRYRCQVVLVSCERAFGCAQNALFHLALSSSCCWVNRKQQLEEAIDDVSKRQAVFEKHPPQQAANTILVYVKSARMALGPPTLKVSAPATSIKKESAPSLSCTFGLLIGLDAIPGAPVGSHMEVLVAISR